MPGPVFREGETVVLRTIEAEDLDYVERLFNDQRVREHTDRHEPAYRSRSREWLDSLGEKDVVVLLVCEGTDPVGWINLFSLDDVVGTAEVGYGMAPDRWGEGFATDALETICRYAFEERGLHKMYARVFVTNPGSKRVLEKVGFHEEGRHREEALVDGDHVDVHRFGLLASEWLQD